MPRWQPQRSYHVATLAKRARTESSNTLTPIRATDNLGCLVGVVRLALSGPTACCLIMVLTSKRDLPDRIGYSRTSKMSHDHSRRDSCRILVLSPLFYFGNG